MKLSDQAVLIARLRDVLGEKVGTSSVRLLETHISYVLLTGEYVYKIKKAVNLGFLDFSTLELRRFYCEEELRLNQRYAPKLYLEVVAIGGTPQVPTLGGPGAAIEYAVKMREFAQDDLAGNLLARGELGEAQIDLLAAKLAAFHASCARMNPQAAHATAQAILRPARDNFSEMRRLLGEHAGQAEHAESAKRVDRVEPGGNADLDFLAQWTEHEFAARASTFEQRRGEGHVRECHGDLHLGNIARIDGELAFFDCIEFNEGFRWIDVMNEVAFLVMDLDDHGRADLAYRLLNAYLEHTGDYAGLAVLRFYVVYRAMVRAKIALMRVAQSDAVAGELPDEALGYLRLARRWAQPERAALILTHGLSGCGKTTVSQGLLQAIGAIRVRSDVERKRLAGMAASARSGAAIGGGLYAEDMGEATYQRLLSAAQAILAAGYTAIVDATFLRRAQRRLFEGWAQAHAVALAILHLEAPESILRERVARRAREGQDASEATPAVLEHQLRSQEPLVAAELPALIKHDATRPVDAASSAALGRALLQHAWARQPQDALPIGTERHA